MLNSEQVEFFHENGYLHIPQIYQPTELQEMSDALNWLMEEWAIRDKGWVGPWRRALMDEATEAKSQLVALHDLQLYSDAWMRAVTSRRLVEGLSQILDGPVEFHHSTMHVKPPEAGHPFPMHQDHAFYPHTDDRYVDVLVHLDDTCHANGEIRFVAGSNRLGYLDHITQTAEGPCTPHLPTDQYRLEDTVPVPARAGDVVLFNINTIHGSYVNTTDKPRRLVRVGYRHPDNRQTSGQSQGRPGWMVYGRRTRHANEPVLTGAA